MSSENRKDPVFGAKTADLHSLSGNVLDWIFLSTFTSLNDNMLCVSPDDGWYLGVYVKKSVLNVPLIRPHGNQSKACVLKYKVITFTVLSSSLQYVGSQVLKPTPDGCIIKRDESIIKRVKGEIEMENADLSTLDGVGPAIASKFRSADITTIEAIMVTPPSELSEKTGVGFNTILKIVEAARKSVGVGFITAEELWKKRQEMIKLSTGSKNLNELLRGGIESQAMTELIGEFGAGKTQICLMLSIMAQLPLEKGGLNGKVVYMDTEGTFMPERIFEIASGLELDPHETLDNIFLARAYNSSHQGLLTGHLFKFCPENNIKLVIVDSMIGHFRSEYIGREQLSARQQKLNDLLHKLLRLTEAFNLAVVITNQVQANPAQFFGDPNRPAGGHVMAHACTHRVYLRKGSQGTRIAKVIDSPSLPNNKVRFKITEKGIEDAEEKIKKNEG